MALKIGDTVLYSHIGVCKITDKTSNIFNYEDKDYYILSPIFDTRSIYYVPVDYNPEKIHIQPVLTVSQAKELLQYSKNAPALKWINNHNERKQQFNHIFKCGKREEKIRLIKTIRQHEKEQKSVGKQLYAADQRILEGCENELLGELSYVLNITSEELKKYI